MLSRGAVSPLRWSVTALGGGTRRPDSVLARRRARQNGALAAFLGGANVVLWLLQPTWGWHLGVAVASVGLWPLLTVVVFDRRGSG